jgi:predicted kinase
MDWKPEPALLVLVNGAPAAGKTTIARRLARELALPLFARDSFKETLFDTLGWSDREWSAKLGAASWELLYVLIGQMLDAGQSLIAEGNFHAQWANPRLVEIQARHTCRIVQLFCETDGETLLARYRQRVETGERHPGHADHLNFDTMRVFLNQRWEPLAVGELIYIDTTHPERIDFAAVAKRIREAV